MVTQFFFVLAFLGMSMAMPAYIDSDFNDNTDYEDHKPTTTTTTTTTAAPPAGLPGKPFAALGAALAPAIATLAKPVITGLALGVGNAIKKRATTTPATTTTTSTTTKPPHHASYLDAFLIHIPGSSANLVLVSTDSSHGSNKGDSALNSETKYRAPTTQANEEQESVKNSNADTQSS